MLRVFENRALRRKCGLKRDEGTVEWSKIQNAELSVLCSSPNIIRVIKSRRMKWAGHVARMAERRGVYRVFVGKLEGKRPLGRPRGRWEDNVKTDLQKVGCGGMDWIELAQMGTCECGNEPSGSISPLAPEFPFKFLAQPVFKMRIIQEPKKVAL